tara:strand:+ start:2313 stop:3542 length:1230 start_codon:yes stop_codon:yes gene_type:complete
MSNKKKILFVGPYPPPFGGIASHLKDLLPELLKHGHEVLSLTWSNDNRINQNNGFRNLYSSQKIFFLKNIFHVLNHFVQCLLYKQNANKFSFFKAVNNACLINKICENEDISSIFIYDNGNGMVIPILKKHFKLNYPIAFMIFGDFYLRPNFYKAQSDYYYDVLNQSDYILSSSQYCADSIPKVLGHDDLKGKVIYVGVNHNTYNPEISGNEIRLELEIPSDGIVLLFLGRMVKEMGLDFLLKNIDEILNIDKDLYLIIAGAEGNLSQQASQFAKHNIRIKYCPNIPFENKAKYYSASDVILSPSMEKHACMGVTIKEAMACGKPVIGSTSGGIPEAIEDGLNGYLIPIKSGNLDLEIFLKKTKYLIDNPNKRKQMGEVGRTKVLKTFTNEQTTQKYLNLLEIMLENSK